MRTIAAHTNHFAPDALSALFVYAPEVEFVETKGLYGYNEAIASRWDGSDTLVVIEQDKEITAEVLPSFERCDKPWCVYRYDVFPDPYTKSTALGLGCTKYSAEAQKLVSSRDFNRPDYDFWPKHKLCDGNGCWAYLDARIAMALMMQGIAPHIHGKVTHHHDYGTANQWLDKVTNDFEGQPGIITECPACGSHIEKSNTSWICASKDCLFEMPYHVR